VTKTITTLLAEVQDGRPEAGDQLMPLIYERLHRIAAAHFAHERAGHLFQPTDLIQDVYLRLVKPGAGPWKNRSHFFAVASRCMRRILVDYARARRSTKRGGPLISVDWDEALLFAPRESRFTLELEDALHRLERRSARQGRVVELRFFGGLTVRETAKVLRVSPTTVKEDWAFAKAWLQRELEKVR